MSVQTKRNSFSPSLNNTIQVVVCVSALLTGCAKKLDDSLLTAPNPKMKSTPVAKLPAKQTQRITQ